MKSLENLKGKKILVRQVRSTNGRDGRFKDTIKAIGLGRIGRSRVHQANDALIGMLQRVSTVLEVSLVK